MGSYRESVLSAAKRNNDLMFLCRKLDWGNPYISLAYWIANDRFAERIRGMVVRNAEITNETVLYVMQEIFLEYRHEVETGNEPDFNFALAKKVMRRLEDASGIEPWSSSAWDRNQWNLKPVFPAGFEDLSYIADLLNDNGIRPGLVRSICKNEDILSAIRENGIVDSLDGLKTVIKTVFQAAIADEMFRKSSQKGRFFRLRRIATELECNK